MTKTSDAKTSTKAGGGTGNKWLNYLKSYREKNVTKGKKQKEILKEAGRLWKEMSETDKAKFVTPGAGPTKK